MQPSLNWQQTRQFWQPVVNCRYSSNPNLDWGFATLKGNSIQPISSAAKFFALSRFFSSSWQGASAVQFTIQQSARQFENPAPSFQQFSMKIRVQIQFKLSAIIYRQKRRGNSDRQTRPGKAKRELNILAVNVWQACRSCRLTCTVKSTSNQAKCMQPSSNWQQARQFW